MKQDVDSELAKGGDLSREERDFLMSLQIAFDGVIIFANRLADALEDELKKASEPERRDVLATMLANCRRVPLYPAETFYEAVDEEPLLDSDGCDRVGEPDQCPFRRSSGSAVQPYYRKDIDQGRITREEARELLEEILLKIMTHNIRPESNFIGDILSPLRRFRADHSWRADTRR